AVGLGAGSGALADTPHARRPATAHAALHQADDEPQTDAGTGRFAGIVTTSRGAAIAGATVRLLSETTGESRTAVTARDGAFSFGGLEEGPYWYRVEGDVGVSDAVRAEVQNAATKFVTVKLLGIGRGEGGRLALGSRQTLRTLHQISDLVVIARVGS